MLDHDDVNKKKKSNNIDGLGTGQEEGAIMSDQISPPFTNITASDDEV